MKTYFCFLFPVSCFLFPVSCFLFPVSCFLFPVSCFLFPVSCFLFPVSCFLFPVSCFLFPVSCFLFPVSCFRNSIIFIIQAILLRKKSKSDNLLENIAFTTKDNAQKLRSSRFSSMRRFRPTP
ncbi:hypothetical protein GLX_24250 [Komagataeibacter medellinensis NBRC 3288]|uniref:Uncharacterized protein n=1 Tax=Komagataeibacter medellinensis (strain NBRC 3288 / BCRC 11682 / LMG 1693 / Kondo 51) TaxID=634177 RepID=G2I1Q1_KOMMN|nr:hypothetical protein GLX_24250 [Komagataeibacter medellinensis NBRC 3288]